MIGGAKEVDWTDTSVQFLRAAVIAYTSWVGIRPPAVRITTAINPQRLLWNAETRAFICFSKAYYRERVLFFSPTLPGGPNCLLFKGAHLPLGELATLPVRHCLWGRKISSSEIVQFSVSALEGWTRAEYSRQDGTTVRNFRNIHFGIPLDLLNY
ncbi:hypothetical protein AVEN_51272-1 [Araneus ventricosus]|uniref:Uncharacterized protein n=1 Tax=Araneus ventricosus TaxID=182803 RepID=A0A4Y2NFZ0_ARAVE|nr:hypothetical protein AVEN_51272-1 [Araneus ventricosus]